MGQVGQYVARSVLSVNVDSGICSDFFLLNSPFFCLGYGIFLRDK